MRIRKLLTDDKHIAMSNGVCLSSTVHKGWYAIAWCDRNGNIQTMWENKRKLKQQESGNSILNRRIKKIILFLLLLNLLLFPIAFFSLPAMIAYVLYLPLLPLPATMLYFIFSTSVLSSNEKRYHGALHMLLNSWNKGKQIKTPLALLQHKQFYINCHSNVLTLQIFFWSIISVFYVENFIGFSEKIIEIAIYTLTAAILVGVGCFNWLQCFSTLPPTYKEAAVVLAASKLLLEKEDE